MKTHYRLTGDQKMLCGKNQKKYVNGEENLPLISCKNCIKVLKSCLIESDLVVMDDGRVASARILHGKTS